LELGDRNRQAPFAPILTVIDRFPKTVEKALLGAHEIAAARCGVRDGRNQSVWRSACAASSAM